MDKLTQLVKEFKEVCTNDPVSQRRIVKILEQLLVVLKDTQEHVHGTANE